MNNLGHYEWTDPVSVSGAIQTDNGEVVTQGSSSFIGGMHVDMTTKLGRGADDARVS